MTEFFWCDFNFQGFLILWRKHIIFEIRQKNSVENFLEYFS